MNCGNYVKVYCEHADKPILSLYSLKFLEELLPPDKFVRVHRSYIIWLDVVSVIEEGSLTVGQENLSIGTSYRKRLQECVSRLTVGVC